MSIRRALLIVLATAWPVSGGAAPYVPKQDALVIERLSIKPGSPVAVELHSMRAQLTREPANHEVAARLARRYYELADTDGDPRFIGYAQATLGPWWDLPQPPTQVLMVRAMIRQYLHDFPGALADLSQLVSLEPRNGRAWALRKVVNTVLANYEEARADCEHMRGLLSELTVTACFGILDAMTGNAKGGYESLTQAMERRPDALPVQRLVIQTVLAEMADQMGEAGIADRHFKSARALRIPDRYLLARYADYLLDQGRPREVVALLGHGADTDVLLLRLTIAEKKLQAGSAERHRAQLQSRFAAARIRDDRSHSGEEARFALFILDQPRQALRLAQENWNLQREPRDARILLEAAAAANDIEAARPALDWLARSRNEDVYLNRLARRLKGGATR